MSDAPAERLADNNIAEPDNGAKLIGSAELARISDRLNDLVAQGAEYHRRSVHREAIIDRLHEENQKLRDEVRASVFDPITADLMRLYDSFRRDADRLTESGTDPGLAKLMESYADDVELILDRCGLEPFSAAVGEPFRRGDHVVAGTVEASDPAQRDRIAEVIAVGFRDRATGQIKRPLRAKFYRPDVSADN
jgi:molecular chaperone GrpE (heat shock protein)